MVALRDEVESAPAQELLTITARIFVTLFITVTKHMT
jgi:hypothetical protein